MGLTVNWNWQMPAVADPNGPSNAVEEGFSRLGKGIGAAVKYGRKAKAADMMEGRAGAEARIAEIDKELKELEGQLSELEVKRDREQFNDNRSAAQEQMEGYRPNSASVGYGHGAGAGTEQQAYGAQEMSQQRNAALAGQNGQYAASQMQGYDQNAMSRAAANQMAGYAPDATTQYARALAQFRWKNLGR